MGLTHPDLTAKNSTDPTVGSSLLGIPGVAATKASEQYEALFRELRLMKERGGQLPEAPRDFPNDSPSWSPI